MRNSTSMQESDSVAVSRHRAQPHPTLPSSVLRSLERRTQGPSIRFLAGDHGEEQVMTRAELLDRAACAARWLHDRGVGPGDRIAIALSTGPDLLATFLATWMLGAATVPVSAEGASSGESATLRRLDNMLEVVRPSTIVGDESSLATFASLERSRSVRSVLASEATASRRPLATWLDDPSLDAHLQLSSGTTGLPRAAVHDHRRIVENAFATAERVAIDGSRDRFLAWLPMHHDMGFIGGFCVPLLLDVPLVLMPTERFTARPMAWLEAMSQHRITLSPNPSFAYQLLGGLLARRRPADLDLSAWRYGWMGAEPVLEPVIQAFEAAYRSCGLRPTTIRPCYGLAEATLAVSMPEPDARRVVECIDRRILRERGLAERCDPDARDAMLAVGCGTAIAGTSIEIRSESGHTLGDRSVGRVLVRSPSVMRGYFGVAAAEQPLHDGWLDTGDLGFLIGGELFLSGRAKDLIIRGGANIHPHEIEEAVQRLPEIRPGRLAVFQTGMTAARENEVVCAIETRLADGPERDRLERDVRAAALDGSGVAIQRVAFVAPGGIPRTTSGKVQRRQARERYEAGTL